jgi:hypothetical protein
MNQMQIMSMMQMCAAYPMMKHQQTPGAQPQTPIEPQKQPEPEKKL